MSERGDGSDEAVVTDQPLYVRALRLRHLRLPTWWRVSLAEGSFVLGVLLAMTELTSAWVIVVLPISVAGMVKLNDVVQGVLARSDRGRT